MLWLCGSALPTVIVAMHQEVGRPKARRYYSVATINFALLSYLEKAWFEAVTGIKDA